VADEERPLSQRPPELARSLLRPSTLSQEHAMELAQQAGRERKLIFSQTPKRPGSSGCR